MAILRLQPRVVVFVPLEGLLRLRDGGDERRLHRGRGAELEVRQESLAGPNSKAKKFSLLRKRLKMKLF